MEAFLGAISKLIGSDGMKGIMDLVGSEGMSNLIKGGTALYSANQTGDYLDFQKNLATKADARTETMFQNDQTDRTAMQNIDWGASTPAPPLTQYT